MWSIDNRTPFGVDRNWTRDPSGCHHWIVALRATFNLDDHGELVLADKQPPPALDPEYSGQPGLSSLRWDSDLLRVKLCTDVIAEAYAHAPNRRPVGIVPVQMKVGPITKRLVVYGPRTYRLVRGGVVPTAPELFLSSAITYEWAYGGTDFANPDPKEQGLDERNPVGKGFAVKPERLEGEATHSVEFPEGRPEKAGPAGFGPIDVGWLPRRGYAGTYDLEWERDKKPLLPDDYDDLYGSCAPADQRIDSRLTGGERVELTNLSPSGLIQFQLPRFDLRCSSRFGRSVEEHRFRFATLLLQPELKQVVIVWQTSLMVPAEQVEWLDETLVVGGLSR